jgi:hypothetical protein
MSHDEPGGISIVCRFSIPLDRPGIVFVPRPKLRKKTEGR